MTVVDGYRVVALFLLLVSSATAVAAGLDQVAGEAFHRLEGVARLKAALPASAQAFAREFANPAQPAHKVE